MNIGILILNLNKKKFAIKFKILSEEGKIIDSLYIIIGNNLYNLIFTGNEAEMKEVGESIFNDIINSLEF